jgi:hypothetical protein
MKKLLLATAAACSISSAAFADEVLKLKTFTHVVAAQSLDVGDADGHAMSIARGVGLLLLPDGAAGTTTWVAENDYHKGSGPNPIVYLSFTWPDGSTIWARQSVDASVVGDKTNLKGVGTLVSGTGKFAGVRGEIVSTGARLQAALATGAELYIDVAITIKN